MSINRFAVAVSLAAVLALGAGSAAWGQVPASENTAGTSWQSSHDMTTMNEWIIGTESDPIDVILDPDAGPWIKNLAGPNGGPVSADDTGQTAPSIFNLTEFLHVGGTIPWTDWHQEIRTAGWYPRIVSVLANGNPIPGLQVDYTDPVWPNKGGAADITFPPLMPCTNVKIVKQLVWEGDPGNIGDLFNGIVVMAQYPTPEPAALGLLAAGALALLRRRRRA